MTSRFTTSWLMAGALLATLSGCSGDDKGTTGTGGAGGGTGGSGTAGTGTGGSGGSGSLRPFTAPADPGEAGILFSASGESPAPSGYAFPPASPPRPQFFQWWALK